VGRNPFLRVLRASFDGLYRRAAERGERTVVLVPCSECLEKNEVFSQVFMETHITQSTHVPGCFMNLLGQGLEIGDSSVSTHLGFAEHRVCEVLQRESIHESSCGGCVRVLVLDKPLIGRFKAISGQVAPSSPDKARPVIVPGDSPTDWINSATHIHDAFCDQLNHFRKTFVQVPGCESSTAERIREITEAIRKRLIKHHSLTELSQQRQLDYQVSREAYALLHTFVFPHLQRMLASHESRLEKAIMSYASLNDLVMDIPGVAGRGLALIDLRSCSEQLELLDDKISPHEKISCINEAHSMLQRCVEEGVRGGSKAAGGGVVEITGDDVLSLFIMALRGAGSLKHRLAHVAHVEMYLQGAAGRSGSNEAARFEEAGYAVAALQAALQFFLEERPAARGAGAPRTTTNVFSSYLGSGGSEADTDGARQARQR